MLAHATFLLGRARGTFDGDVDLISRLPGGDGAGFFRHPFVEPLRAGMFAVAIDATPESHVCGRVDPDGRVVVGANLGSSGVVALDEHHASRRDRVPLCKLIITPVVALVARGFAGRERLEHLVAEPAPVEVAADLVASRFSLPLASGAVEVVELDHPRIREEAPKAVPKG